MADIRKRTGAKGTTYQVRYPTPGTKSGYAYATFSTLKEARAFRFLLRTFDVQTENVLHAAQRLQQMEEA